MPSITFTAATLRDLERDIRAFLGEPPVVVAVPAGAASGRPLPTWAPAGSRWLDMPGAPVLEGPDGKMIPLDWTGVQAGGEPKRGEFVRYHDVEAEAAGAALLASQRGE